jgi:hypothetical protein
MFKKILLLNMLFFLFFSAVSFAVEECIACENVTDAPETNVLISMDDENNRAEALVYYENYTADEPRIPVTDSIVFIYVMPSVGENELLRTYTDDEGRAPFDFSSYAIAGAEERITYVFRFIYCPFCYPGASGYPCGFDECMKFAGIETAYESPDDVPLASGVEVPSELNEGIFLPSSRSVTYVPPPPEATGATTPAFCLPLVLIFALLGGALYYTGRNPFAAFNISTPRVSRHIRYTPTGRGYSLSARYVMSSIKSAAKEAKEIKKEMGKGAGLGKAVGKVSFQIGEKGAAKNIALNALTLGTYSNVVNLVGTVKGGRRVVSEAKVAGKAGVEKEEKVEVTPTLPAKEIIKGAKAKGRGAFIAMFQAGRTPEGKIDKKAGAKAFGKIIGGAFLKVGIGVLGSGFASIFISEGAMKRMTAYTDKLLVSEAAEKLGSKDIAYENLMKLTGGKGAPGKEEIVINKNKATEVPASESPTGRRAYQVTTEKEGVKTTLVVDADSLDSGTIEGTKTVTKEGKTVVYSFSQKVDGTVSTDRVQITEGSGAEKTVKNYVMTENGTLGLQTTTIGEGEGARTFDTSGKVVTELKFDETGKTKEIPATDVPKELESALKEAAGKPTIGSLGLDGAGNVVKDIGEFASTSVEVNMKGKENPVTLTRAFGAEGGYTGTETLKDGTKAEYKVDEGKYNKIIKAKDDFLKTCQDIDMSASNQALGIAGERMGLGVVGEFTEDMKNGIDNMKIEVKKGKKAEIEDGTKALLTNYAPALEGEDIKTKFPGGVDPNTASGKKVITEHFEGAANLGMVQEGESFAAKKLHPVKKELNAGEAAGANALFGLGTGVAGMNKEEAMSNVKAQLDARADLTPQQKAEGLEAADKLWGRRGKKVKNIANDYANFAEQAAAAYPGYLEMQNKALEKLEPLYEGKGEGLKNQIEQTAKATGVAPISGKKAEELGLPPSYVTTMTPQEAITRKIIHDTIDNPLETSLAKTGKGPPIAQERQLNEQKLLLEMVDNGLSKPPEPAKEPDPAAVFEAKTSPKKDESPDDYMKRMEAEGLVRKEGESDEDFMIKMLKKQGEYYQAERETYEKKEKKKQQEYHNFYVGKDSETAYAASTVLLSAIKKGEKLDKQVYIDAGTGIYRRDASKWMDAAREVGKSVEEKERESYRRMVSQAESLKKEKKAGE